MGSGPGILHICSRESIRPLRDQILISNGYAVASYGTVEEGRSAYSPSSFALVLIDIENEAQARDAETLCHDVKEINPLQRVLYACNWYVNVSTDCPDEVVQSAFSPEKFLQGVKDIIPLPPKQA